jgi:hypothetical protein
MADHNREVNDNAGVSDSVSATVQPGTIHAKAHIPTPDVRAGAGVVPQRVTTRSSGVKTSEERTSLMGFPVSETLVIRKGTDGEWHEIELTENGKQISFFGNTEKQGIAKVMMHLLKPKPDFPNN